MTTTAQKIPVGYKQTDVGVIPVDWSAVPFGQIASLRKEKYDSKKSGPNTFSVELEHMGQGTGRLIGHSETTESSSIRNAFRDGDVLFGRLRAYLRKYWRATRDGVSSSEIWALVSNTALTIPDYIFQTVQTDRFTEAATGAYGTHMPRTDWGVIKNLLIALPPTKTEQTAIANALSDVDGLIEKLTTLVEKKKNVKQGVMHELLTGKRRLAGFDGKWKTKKLGDLLDYEQPTPYLVKSTDYSDNNIIPVLTAGKTFILGYTAEETGLFQNLPAIIFDDFTTAIKYVDFPFKAKSSAMKMLVPRNKDVSLKFVYAKMQLIDFKLGDHKRYWISEYQNIEIETPEPDEQAAIATLLSDMDVEIEKLESQHNKYQDIKKGMMQSLLTGKIRLLAK